MKRAGNVFSKIVNEENLKLAWYKAQKRKRRKSDVILFRHNLENNLKRIEQELKSGDFKFGNYHYFKIYSPKERIISAASFEERIVHHAIMNQLELVFDNFQVYDSYACRKGKGVHAAVKRAFYFTKKYKYFVQMDIRKYFDSIEHDVLKTLLRRRIKDPFVLELLDKIINSYSVSENKGIPIGNLTSQYFANFYLAFCDRFIKEELKIKGFARYMDDFVIWDNSKEKLKKAYEEIKCFCDTNLKIEVKPSFVAPSKNGVPFLGFLIKPCGIYLQHKTKKRFKKKVHKYTKEFFDKKWSEDEYGERMQTVISWTYLAKARNYRRNLFKRDRLLARTE